MGPKVTCLIGHRGVGKSTYLKHRLALDPNVKGYDLDIEIALRKKESVADILTRDEPEFRRVEVEILTQILAEILDETRDLKQEVVIALGAGFEGPMPTGVHVLWLRRVTDSSGRLFLNRPRLNFNVQPLDEYLERYPKRTMRFRTWAHEELILPEGGVAQLVEAESQAQFKVPFDLTLLPENFRDWENFWNKRRAWPVRRFELRDDLLTPAQIETARTEIPNHQIIFSHRLRTSMADLNLTHEALKDWPLELGKPPSQVQIISLHERGGLELQGAIDRMNAFSQGILKLAVKIDSFEELIQGHRWHLEDPKRRAFLPSSFSGRWRWYRSLFGPRMPIHFVREGEGSALDQPYLWQSRLQPECHDSFAAVLGDPVEQSLSPLEHLEQPLPFVSIQVSVNEWDSALPVLQELGLKLAAVTSPLKLKAGQLVQNQEALNTLVFDGKKWSGINTDVEALKALKEDLPAHTSVCIWGRGALLDSLKAVWPQAEAISAREGSDQTSGPDLLIWATGRSTPFQFPRFRPRFVLDLNYSEDSPGLEFAVRFGLPYQSGLKMFKLQAAAQRQYWKGFL